MIDSPEVAADYYDKIVGRIAVRSISAYRSGLSLIVFQDTGLGVRKRTIKLLKAFYTVTDDKARRIDICTKLVHRMADDDDTVKDLAVKALEELWFQAPTTTASKSGASNGADVASALTEKVSIIMGVSANYRDRNSLFEATLKKIMADREDGEKGALHACYSEICESLIDSLVDGVESPGFVRSHMSS